MVPLATTTITITDPDYLNYDERIRKYYTAIENIPSLTGKFDGMIEDTVTVFPVESSKMPFYVRR